MNEWMFSLARLVEIARKKNYNRLSRWHKKLSSLSSSWNIWHFQIRGQKPTPFTLARRCYNWRDRFYLARARWSITRRRFGWTRKLDNLRKECADVGKRLKGGIIEMETEIKNERITITDLRAMLAQQDYRCALTGRELTPENCSMDHIVPLSKGGAHSKENAQLVVIEANKAKGMMTEEEFAQLCRDVVAEKDRKL